MRDAGGPLGFSGWRADAHDMRRCVTGSAGFHMTVFELSYQECRGWAGLQHRWR
jgi:hypothetical protein